MSLNFDDGNAKVRKRSAIRKVPAPTQECTYCPPTGYRIDGRARYPRFGNLAKLRKHVAEVHGNKKDSVEHTGSQGFLA